MKNLIQLFVLSLLIFFLNPFENQAQIPIWSIPNSFIDFNEDPPLIEPLPSPLDADPFDDYTGQPAEFTHNAMPGANGSPSFFIVDGTIYDAEGYFISKIALGNLTVEGSSDVCIVPDPGNCQRFYIFTSSRHVGGSSNNSFGVYTILDMSLPNLENSNRLGRLVIGNSAWNSNCTKILSLSLPNGAGGTEPLDGANNPMVMRYAASKLRSDNTHFVFCQLGQKVWKLVIGENGIQSNIEDPIIMSEIMPQYGFLNIHPFDRYEFELIELNNGNYRMGLVHKGDYLDWYHVLTVLDLDDQGNYIPNTVFGHPMYGSNASNAAFVRGLEFSEDGRYLYFTHFVNSANPHAVQYIDCQQQTVHNLNIPNHDLYQFSQIELGIDGNLYFAYANGLASLSSPNSPYANNWNAGAVQFNYPVSFEDPGQNNSRAYILPDQIDGMNYADFPVWDYINHTATQSATWTPANNPFANGNAVVRIESELRIPAGKTVTIKNMRFEFYEDAKCIVEPGGKLIMDETVFTVGPCNAKMWQGVEVWGNPTLAQTPASNQGFLQMKNNSVIEHAKIGALMARRTLNQWGNPTNDMQGGFVLAINSTFHNNEKDVVINDYLSTSQSPDNRCKFTNCTFITDGLLNHPEVFPVYHAELRRVRNVIFLNCSFLNTSSFQDMPIHKRGVGIWSALATFQVKGQNNQFTGNLATNHESFYQLFQGIMSAGYENHMFTVTGMEFQLNQAGIIASGTSFQTVTFNNFYIPEATNPNYNPNPYGAYFINSYMFTVEENSFMGGLDFSSNYGLIIWNSSKNSSWQYATHGGENVENEVYMNSFANLKYGLTVQGSNRPWVAQDAFQNIKGLQARCNVFTNCQRDIFLSPNCDWRDNQGSPGDPPLLTNNEFSEEDHECYSPTDDILVSTNYGNQSYVSLIDNLTLRFRYYCWSDPITKPFKDLNCDEVHMYINEFGGGFKDDSTCVSKLKGPWAPGTGGTVLLNLAQAKIDLQVANGLYEITVDGGEKEDVLAALAQAHNHESQFLRNMLLERYPLSDEVLLSAIERASSFDPWHLTQVLVANARLNPNIMEFLEETEVLSPFFMQFIYEANATGNTSLKEVLINEISYKSYVKSSIERDINRQFLHYQDSLDYTGWHDFLMAQDEDYYKIFLFGEYLDMGQTSQAASILDSLKWVHPDRMDWLQFRLQLAQADSIGATELNTAWYFHDYTEAPYGDVLALLVGLGEITEFPEPPSEEITPRTYRIRNHKNKSAQRSKLEAWPNPAKDRVMLTFPAEVGDAAEIQIYSQQGVLVYRSNTKGIGMAEINVLNWPAGLYIAVLKAYGRVYDEVKITVVK